VAGNPKVFHSSTRERTFRIVLRFAAPGVIAVRSELDGQTAAPEQETRLDADFVFSYQEFLRANFDLAHLGEAVGRAVFPAPVADALGALLEEARAGNESVLLAFETKDRNLLSIPFEAARLPSGRLPALEPGVRMLRRLLGARAGAAGALPGPLRILVAVGAPDEGKTDNVVLDVEAELQTILDAVDAARLYGNAEVKILEVGHPDQIKAAFLDGSYHVLHLSGHGAAGFMELETEDGEALEVSAKDLAGALRAAQKTLPLVMLATCQGGVAASDTASFAQGLLEHGIPMVLAMQTSVSDWYATHLAGAFYGHLTQRGVRLPSHALALARQEVETKWREALRQGQGEVPDTPEYATPSLFCAGDEIPLLDWDAAELESPRRPTRPVAGPVPLLKMGELVGRREELRDLLRILFDDPRAVAKYGRKAGAVLQGIGGVGKSALAGRAMSRLADRGWRLAAIEGRWTLGELATRVGAALFAEEDESIQRLAASLVQSTLPDEVRLQFLAQLLDAHRLLLVLDNFEDNLNLGGTAFLDATTGPILETLARSCQRGKILVTCRYPIPDSKPWLVPLLLGPLSPAQTRKLLYRLTELKDSPPAVLGKILRLIGGHPRMLEYLDAILHKGTGRLSIVEEKLRENVSRLGLKVEDLGGNFEQSLQDAIRIGAQDIFLDELLDTVLTDPEYREVLEQASVFPMPIDLQGLAFALAGAQEPTADRINQIRGLVGKLVRTSLLIPLEDDSVWVHRWTAEALKERMGTAFQEYCRRAGECLLWKIQQQQASDPFEAVRLLLQGAEFEKASALAWSLVGFMNSHGQSLAALSLLEDVLSSLPEDYDELPGFLREAADALFRLGWAGAAERYNQALLLSETRAREHPNRDDYQRDLSVSYDRMGNLLRALGQDEQAKTFYEKSLRIRERLAADEPNRADYQRDLSVSYNKLGDLLRALGQGEQAKTFYEKSLRIIERLAADEPNRIDYKHDLGSSYDRLGDLFSNLRQYAQAQGFYEKCLAIAERLTTDEPNRADYKQVLSVSYNKLGDLLSALGQGEQAKTFYEKSLRIRERLAADEPNRADYQTDLVVSLIRMAVFEPESGRAMLLRALSILETLKARGALLPIHEPWLEAIRRMLKPP
jgi:tetratricopeptide (TPR) repeat protein